MSTNDPKLSSIIHANQAAALLNLERYSQAKEAAIAALKVDPGYQKARYRLADSLLHEGNFTEARNEIAKMIPRSVLHSKDAPLPSVDTQILQNRLENFERNAAGKFNWVEIINACLDSEDDKTNIDILDFTSPKLTVEKSEAADGQGVFAKSAIASGELLVANRAFVFVSAQEIMERTSQHTEDFMGAHNFDM